MKYKSMISVVIPVYNEAETIEELVNRVFRSLAGFEFEIVAIDDGSRDRSGIILDTLYHQGRIKLVRHETNQGKGAAVKSALKEVCGEVIVIQDGDLEYNPDDIPLLVNEVTSGREQVVYGSRNLEPGNAFGYRPYLWGGKFLSLLTTALFGQKLTDINTGYKVFRADFLRSLDLRSSGFEFCEEVTAKALRRGVRIKELPISYFPRKFSEGKKIRARDGFVALLTLLQYRFQRE